ncbi:MAG: FxsA family protein, partial [Actinomycetota bacterium]
ILLSSPIGSAVMRIASAGARVVRRESDPERALERVGSSAGLFLAGLCFLVPGYGSDLVGLVLLVPPIRRWAMRRMTRGFDSFAWVDRMPGFPSSGTVVQGTVVTVEDSTFSDLPDIPRLSDSSEGDNSRKDDPQPPTTVGN